MSNNKLIVYTDGACRGNPGIGSWAAILNYRDNIKKISGVAEQTTNNKMELQATIEALKILNKSCAIDFFVDSKYVMDGITKWIDGWLKNNWRTAAKKPVKNKEQWQQLYQLVKNHQINWYWVKGHSGDVDNDAVDALANLAIDEYLKKKS